MQVNQINPGTAFHQSPNRIVAVGFGTVYLLVGLLGFFWTNGVPFAGPGDGSNAILGIFEVNPLHNVVHLLIGVALIIAGTGTAASAKAANGVIGAAYLLLGIVGFFLAAPDDGRSAINFLSLNTPDHILHLASALLLLATSLGADKGATRDREQPEPEGASVV
ncbi:DUF4383 domain-containing protein [Amnibacterium endophyticum]|uniref:DUF4383 domain-containing protein n=1 Tax=Amnibacterium endophyticum TaxID=2109337 RepID=A0ABW4LEX2_9MICO